MDLPRAWAAPGHETNVSWWNSVAASRLTAVVIALAYAAIALAVSLAIHPIPIEQAENDQYLAALDSFLQGLRCYDDFHPTHTVLAGATVVAVTGSDSFTSLRIVAALGGGLTLFSVHRIAAGSGARLGTCLATSVVFLHPGLFLLGMQASSDALAAGLSMAAVCMALRLQRTGRNVDALLCGLAMGLAVGTRFSAAGFAPVFLAVLRRGSVARLAVAAIIGVAIGYAPHALISTWWTGSPFHNENWRNLVLKYGGFEPNLLVEPGFPDAIAFLARHGLELLWLGAADTWRQVSGGLGRLLVAGPTLWPSVLSTVIVAAHATTFFRPHRGWLVAATSISYLASVCLTFAPGERNLLPLVPMCAVLLALLATSERVWLRGVGVACLAAILVQQAIALPSRVSEFADMHPFAEIEATHTIASRVDVEVVGSTYANMHRFVPGCRYVSAGPPQTHPGEQPLARLRLQMARAGITAVVVGHRTAPWLHAALREADAPSDVEVLANNDDLMALRFHRVEEDGHDGVWWISDFRAEPSLWRDGPLTMRIVLTDSAEVDRVAAAAVRLELTPDKGPSVELRYLGDRAWQVAWPVRPPVGEWTLRAQLRLRDGRYVRGPRCKITVQ